MRVRSLVAVLAVLATARQASAQEQQQPAACTYDSCALRVEPGWWGTHVVRGTAGERVVSIGFTAPDLAAAVQRSDSAARHARAFQRDHNRSSVLGLVSGALVGLSAPGLVSDLDSGDDPEAWEWAAVAGGFGLGLVSGYYQLRARRELERAVWWYNRELPDE